MPGKGRRIPPTKISLGGGGGKQYKETAQGNDQEMIGQAEDDILRCSKGHGAGGDRQTEVMQIKSNKVHKEKKENKENNTKLERQMKETDMEDRKGGLNDLANERNREEVPETNVIFYFLCFV